MFLSEITTGTTFDVGVATDQNDSLNFTQLPSEQIAQFQNSPGTDLIFLLAGDDWAFDNGDSRNYFGLGGNDTVFAGGGDDAISGHVGNDLLFGNQGDDILFGGQNNDTVYGGEGNDVLNGNLGIDVLTGGRGSDTFEVVSGDENTDRITDFEVGVDKIYLTESYTFEDLQITTTNLGEVLITIPSSNQQIAMIEGIAATDLSAVDFTSVDPLSHHAVPDSSFGEHSFNDYEAFLHPAQEPGEAIDSDAKGYGLLRFPENLSSGQVEVEISGVDPSEINGFHIHCGPPGVLGPIVINLGEFGPFEETIVDGHFSATLSNEDIVKTDSPPDLPEGVPQLPDEGLPHSHEDLAQLPDDIPRLPEGCPIDSNFPGQVITLAGVESLAKRGLLYFNVHTEEHSFYGEMRGQIYPAEE